MSAIYRRFSVVLSILGLVAGSLLSADRSSGFENRLEMVPMRDGTRLATFIWFPKGSGPWPVVLVRTPYGAETVVDNGESQRLLENGYVLAAQDMRGRFKSEGKALAFTTDGWGKLQDGYDTVEWIAKQPWCNGKIGTWGKSGPGITQILMAGSAPPHLTCQHIGIAAADLWSQAFFQGGELRLELVINWLHHGGWDVPAHVKMAQEHPTYDRYWSEMNLCEPNVHPNAPMLNWSGWYDIFSQGAIDTFMAARRNGGPRARNNQILIMGPWPHGIAKDFGEAHLPFEVLTPPMIDYLAYFDYYLKGKKNEIASAKPVYYYTIGDITDPNCKLNRWRSADDWPPPCKYTPMYLQPNGGLSFQKPTARESSRSFTYDPDNPVPTLGGNNLFLEKGPFDNRELEKRADVLVYTSEPLETDIEVTGRIKVKLFVSSDCKDTDFTAKLCDVYQDGRSLNVLDGIVRMSYTDSFRKRRLLVPGKTYEAEIDLWSTSWIFRQGHRIRLDISSSNYPRFETNPNTGEFYPLSVQMTDPSKPNPDRRVVKARNTVYSDAKHLSRIILPVAEAQ